MLTVEDFTPEIPAILALLRQIVEIESPSTEKAAVDRCGAFLAQELDRLGAQVEVDAQSTAGNNIVGRWAGGEGGGILLLCHMDTVFSVGTLAQRPFRIADDRLSGPGVQDMKGGIAMGLTVLRVLRERRLWPHRPLTCLLTSDEETGSACSRALIEALARQSALVVCLEPGLEGGAIKTARKGTGTIEIVTRGRAAHAGSDHAKGRNAIEELAHHILAAQRLTDYAAGTTVSVGIVNGGTRTNVVPDQARARADVRVADSKEVERLQQWAAAIKPVLQGTSVEASAAFDRPPMPRDSIMAATFARAQAIAARAGLPLSEGSTGGVSDGNFVAALGVPLLDGMGVLGDGAHSEREYMDVSSLPQRAALLAALLREWH